MWLTHSHARKNKRKHRHILWKRYNFEKYGDVNFWLWLLVLVSAIRPHLWPLTFVFLSEVHPLLGVKGDSKSKKKAAGRPKGSKGKDKDSPFRPKVCRDRAEGLGTPGKTPLRPLTRGLSSAVIGRIYFLLAFLSFLLWPLCCLHNNACVCDRIFGVYFLCDIPMMQHCDVLKLVQTRC